MSRLAAPISTISAVALALALAVALPASAPAADPAPSAGVATADPDFTITRVDTSRFPNLRVAITSNADGSEVPNFSVSENDATVGDVRVFPGQIGQYESTPKPVIIIALDASNSMAADDKLANARLAAARLIAQAGPDDRIGLVTFGGGSQVVVEPTTDHDAVLAAVNATTLTAGTAMFDGIDDAINAFPKDATRRIVVVLSDGADVGSTTTSSAVAEGAAAGEVEIHSVVLAGADADPGTLETLAAATSGSSQTVSSPTELAGVFETLGRDLLRGYWLDFSSTQAAGSDVKLVISAPGSDSATQSFSTPSVKGTTGEIKITRPPAVKPDEPAISLPGGAVGVLLVALPFALLLTWLGITLVLRRSRTPLSDRLAPYTPGSKTSERGNARGIGDARGGIKQALAPLFRLTESILGRTSLFARFRRRLEQANLPLREVELLYAMVALGVLSLIIAAVTGTPLMLLPAAAAFGAWLPYAWVAFKAMRRKKKFESQLADVLGTVAASLKAGHSFNQSIAAVAKEAPDPTAHELKRVMAEARLGMPMEEALEAMAIRMDSADFEFAVTTVNIQRTVGGSLSEILDMVADTVRNRQQFRKKVKALTSMGSMSAYVLLGMPLFMAGMLTLMSAEYMAPLWTTPTGHKLLMGGAFFMFLGWISCRKIVAIKT